MEEKGEKSLLIQTRRRAREAALQALYQCDTLGDISVAQVDFFFTHFYPECAESAEGSHRENLEFSKNLVSGVIREIAVVDNAISAASAHWSVARMARVDRNILRIAAYELKFMLETPPSVIINEGIEIAKRFSNPDSPTFINGVLDHISKMLRPLVVKAEESESKKEAA